MADKYDLCPCGSGKKVKFCCKDFAPDIEKVSKLLESEQRAAALQHLNRVIEKHGPEPALMDLKITALIEMQQFQEAEEVVLNLLQANPDAPRPHALAAIMDVLKGNIDDAVRQLQRAFQQLKDEDNPIPVFDALSMVASALFEGGGPYETRAHLLQWLKWAGEQHSQQPLRMLLDLDSEIHPLLLIELDAFDPPADAEWRDEYIRAQKLAERGAWVAAAEKLNDIARDVELPRLKQEYALLVGRSGARKEMVSALHDFARMDGVEFKDAVEAEAIAQLLDTVGATDIISMQFEIEDADGATEKLLSNDSCFSVDPSRMPREEGEAPARGVFIALSKPFDRDAEPSYENTPIIQGQIRVFGRETDRAARIEVTGSEGAEFDAVKALAEAAIGESLGDGKERTVVGGGNRINSTIAPQLFFAPGVSQAQQFEIQSEMLEDRVNNVWTATPHPHLGEKSPEEAAKDESLRVKLAAALVLIEQTIFLSLRRLDTSDLRKRLNVPLVELTEKIDLESLHRTDYLHVDVKQLDDDQLMQVMRGGMVRARRLTAVEAVEEAIERKLYEKDDDLTLDRLYDLLIRWNSSSAKQLEIIQRAKENVEPLSEQMGGLLLQELVIRIEAGEGPEAKQLIDRLTQQHQTQEAVMQGLMQVLSRYGLLGPPGGPGGPMGGAPQGQSPMSTSDVALQMAQEQQASEPSDGGLWTPDSGPPEGGGEDKPSGLWLPD